MEQIFIHPTAEVSPSAKISQGTKIWHQAQVRERAIIGSQCNIGKGAYIDFDVVIGDRCKIQNGVYVYHGATLGDGVLLGPGAMILNDKYPRAIKPDGSFKSDSDWVVSTSHIGYGASVGGGAVIAPGVTVGKWAHVGAGTVATKNVPDHGVVYGNPGRLYWFACPCGTKLVERKLHHDQVEMKCISCGSLTNIAMDIYDSRQGHI